MTATVKASSALDFLRHVPLLLGYIPTDSLVVIPMANSRTLGAMRFDFPPQDEGPVASTVVGLASRVPETTALIVIAYVSAPAGHAVATLQAVRHHAGAAGLHIMDLMFVASDGWGSVLEDNQGTTLHPLDELVLAEVEGVSLRPGNQADDHDSGVELGFMEDVIVALDELTLRIRGGERVGNDTIMLFEAAATEELDAKRLAELIIAVERPAFRDCGIVTWTGGSAQGYRAAAAQNDWEQGAEYPGDLAMVMWGDAPRPDPARLQQALANVRRGVDCFPAAGGYATAAWLKWALGLSTHAEQLALKGLEIEPEHGLCEIVLSFVKAGHLPDWAFQR